MDIGIGWLAVGIIGIATPELDLCARFDDHNCPIFDQHLIAHQPVMVFVQRQIRCQVAIPSVQQHTHRAVAIVGYRQIPSRVPVKVGGRYRIRSIPNGILFIVDEIGPMELKSEVFSFEVERILESNKPMAA